MTPKLLQRARTHAEACDPETADIIRQLIGVIEGVAVVLDTARERSANTIEWRRPEAFPAERQTILVRLKVDCAYVRNGDSPLVVSGVFKSGVSGGKRFGVISVLDGKWSGSCGWENVERWAAMPE